MKPARMLALLGLLLVSAVPLTAQTAPGVGDGGDADTTAPAENALLEGLRRANPHRVGARSITNRAEIGIPISPDDKYPRLRLGLDAATVWQNLDHTGDTLLQLSPGFQAAVGNLYLTAGIVEGIDVYAEFYIGSKGHQGQFHDREGYVMLSSLPESWDLLKINTLLEHIDIKAGHFEVDFGNQHLFRSDNAEVQKNPLIGNFIVDPNTVEAGLEIIGNEGIFNWLAGIGGGVTTESFLDNRGTSLHGKVWLEPADARWNVAGSIFTVDHSGTVSKAKGGTWTEMYSGNRSGSRYSRVLNGGGDAGQINFGQGKEVTATQLDGSLDLGRVWLYGMYGRFKDADLNGSEPGEPAEKWSYYGIEGKIDLVPDRIYAAGRYGRATTELLNGVEMDAFTDRVQVGLGYWMFDNMLFKAEYMTQRFEDFSAVRWTDDPEFSGFLIEGSVSF